MKKRNIGIMVLLFLFTFGIYPVVFNIKFHAELKRATGKGFGVFGHILMSLFTFGIYQIYWQFAAGRRLAMQGVEDRGVLYLVFCFIGLSWLNPFLMASQANSIVEKEALKAEAAEIATDVATKVATEVATEEGAGDAEVKSANEALAAEIAKSQKGE